MGNSFVTEFSVRKARKAQALMAQKVINEDRLPKEIKVIAGVDAAYAGNLVFGAAAVLDYNSLEVLETQTVVQRVRFPYVPTLFSFRELPAAVECIKKLKLHPEVFLVDGHGVAHPYKFGLASHLGLALKRPTVGVAKNKLVGKIEQLGENFTLTHEEETIGAVVSTHKGGKPIFVSVGHMVSLETAVKIVKHCSRWSRVPEPIRRAHKLATKERKAKIGATTNTGTGEYVVEYKTQRNHSENTER